MSKDAYYFSHDSNARNDQRLIKIRMKYGMEGYGVYFGIIEILREKADYYLYKNEITTIAFDLRVDESVIEDIIYNYSLFIIDGKEYPPETFYSRSLTRRMEKLDLIKQKRAEAGRKGGKSKPNDNQVLNNSLTSKAKESIAKESRGYKILKRSEDFEISLQKYINQYDSKMLEEFFDYWTEPNKSNTKMLFETKKTWDLGRRLKRWAGNDFGNNKSNGVAGFRKDANGKFWIGYCSECNVSDFYDDIGIKQDSRCCQTKLMPKKKKGVYSPHVA